MMVFDSDIENTHQTVAAMLGRMLESARKEFHAMRDQFRGFRNVEDSAEVLDRDYIHNVHDSVGKALRIIEDGAIDTALDTLNAESSRELSAIRTLADTLAGSLERVRRKPRARGMVVVVR